MRTIAIARVLGGAALIVTLSGRLGAQQPRLTLEPAHPAMGSLVRVTLERVQRAGDSVMSVSGTMAGEPLHFKTAAGGRLVALAAVPIDASDSVVATVRFERQQGPADSARLVVRYPHRPPPTAPARGRVAGGRRLRVDAKFTKADADADARVERENELARGVGRRAQATPQLWTLPFLKPRTSRVTSRFGSGRVFNGRVASSHLGIDYRGQRGEPIVAANRGVVALVDEFYLAGNVIYIDHGDGVVTGYFHLSRQDVAVGDTVERGQQIGLVGATGRVTGPHLHWSARFGSLTIDPADLFALRPPFVALPIRKD